MLEFAGRFSDPNLLVKDFKFWAIVLKDSPSTLGQVVFVLKREAPDFSSVLPEEMAEFPLVCKWFEEKTKKLFGAVKFNYAAIMLKEQFVHFNVFPRYSQPVEAYGVEWIDEGWPKKVIEKKIEMADEVKKKVIDDLKA